MYIATVCLMSGLNMNVEKTVVVWIGSREHSPVKFMPELNLNWNPATFKVLGVVFSTNVHGIVLNNYENKLKEMENILNAWSRRNVTPFGKITVIKTLVLSKVTHLVMNLPDSDEKFLQALNLLLYKFLLDGKYDTIKRSGVCQAHEADCLKMVDVKSLFVCFEDWLA